MSRYKIRLGKQGEQLAARWLLQNGYAIVFRNWRSGRYEIDIVARKGNLLHVFEIKTRRGVRYGFPEDGMTKRKYNNLRAAASAFMEIFCVQELQVDILSVMINNRSIEFFLIENIGGGYQQ